MSPELEKIIKQNNNPLNAGELNRSILTLFLHLHDINLLLTRLFIKQLLLAKLIAPH
jgi:hypothetical protein